MKVKIEKAKGYERGGGKYSRKSYVARINDLSGGAETFDRTFPGATSVDWGDSQLYRKSKGVWTETYELGPGVYEICQWGERIYRVAYARDGETKFRTVALNELVEALRVAGDARTLVEHLGRLAARAMADGGIEAVKDVTLRQAAEAVAQ